LKSIKDSPLIPITQPKSVAVFGASNRIGSMGTNLLSSIMDIGFEGKIYPVHPKETSVLNLKAYPSIETVPEVPDLALLVLPTRLVADTLDACGRKGIKHAIVVSGGFKEVGGEGPAMEENIVAVARRHGMRFLGPNCIGVANPHHKFNSTFLPFTGLPGFIGMVSQSGSFITQLFDYLGHFGLGFSSGISVGNEANIDMVDCLEYLADCPHTKVIALYIEAVRRGRDFIRTARSIVPHKPIVAFYVGGSEAGRQAGFSHTGALAGPDNLYDGVFRQSGIIRARSIEEMFDFCLVLGVCPVPEGNRVVIQTHSGGPGAAAADACGRSGLHLARLSDGTRENLKAYVPHTGSLNNPVDITFSRNPLDYFEAIPDILLKEEDADAMLMYLLMPRRNIQRTLESMGVPASDIENQTAEIVLDRSRVIAGLLQKSKKPLIGYSFSAKRELMIPALLKGGVPVLPSPERAARSLGALVQYSRIRDKLSVKV
jgi:acyl-CoA synthetase (NDP forming)